MDPARETRTVSHSVRPRSVTRRAPAPKTKSPTPRLDQRTKRSKVRRTRNAGGTGSTPHSGGLRRRSIGRPKPPPIYRVRGSTGGRAYFFAFANFLYEC